MRAWHTILCTGRCTELSSHQAPWAGVALMGVRSRPSILEMKEELKSKGRV